MPLEEELKFRAGPGWPLPDLSACLPAGGSIEAAEPVTLTATYYDTADLRLARSGVSLRYRRGRPAGGAVAASARTAAQRGPQSGAEDVTALWTVKLPSDVAEIRHEISQPGPPGTPPARLAALVTAYHRGAALRPVTTLRTRRRAYRFRDARGEVLAELADDAVAVLDGRRVAARFREIEVERVGGGRALLARVGAALIAAGAAGGDFIPKHVRAMGRDAAQPPDLLPPADLARKPRAGDVVANAIRRGAARIAGHDPLVRLRMELPDGDTAVHQMRVGCRRLRSDLRTFGPLLDGRWARELRAELGWLAAQLGAARDAEVLRARLRRTAAADPLAPPDGSAVARIDAELAARHGEALDALDAVLACDRYLALLDRLLAAAAAPRLIPLAQAAASEVLPRLVAAPWRRFAFGARGVNGAVDLSPDGPDAAWHAVRVHGKRARYAVEAVAGVIGGEAAALAKALAAVQDVLGEHQDAAVAAETWLSVARSDPDDHALAVTAGRLYERERSVIRAVRRKFPAAWRAASKPRRVAWLP